MVDNVDLNVIKKFEELAHSGFDPQKVVSALINRKETRNMSEKEFKNFISGEDAVIDENYLKDSIKKVVAENPKAVEDYKKGKENSLQFIFGQVVRNLGRKVDPSIAIPLIKEAIKEKS